MTIRWNWSISIYTGADPLHLEPAADTPTPVLSRADVTDVPAGFVADPFMLYAPNQTGRGWHMFFEVWNDDVEQGEIGYASSADGRAWHYEQIALRMPYHLSYPYVFAWEGTHFMVPETRQDGAVNLFVADQFPYGWRKEVCLLEGDFADASLFHHDDKWWMFVIHGTEDMMIFQADDLTGPWLPHAENPVIPEDRTRARPAGRPVRHEGRLIRYGQDCLPAYGFQVRAFTVDELSSTTYRETEAANSPILKPTRVGWNALKMHHVDAMNLGDDGWIACVDGATLVRSAKPAPEGASQRAVI